MPKISEEQRRSRREQIMAAAWRCFFRTGIQGTSMEEIIREAQLSAGAVYLYYSGKDELIFAAISTYMTNLRDRLLPILTAEEPLPPLEFVHQITSRMAAFTKRSGLDLNAIILMCWSEAQTNERVKTLVGGFQINYLAAMTRVVRLWQRRGDLVSGNPQDVSRSLLSFFYGFIAQSALIGELSPKTIKKGMRGLLAAGPAKDISETRSTTKN
jgi:AcrR family transcriptional regulator